MSTIEAPRRTHRVRTIALGVVAMLAMSSCQPNRFISGWIPYWGGTKSRAAITDASTTTLFSEASLFWYGARGDGTVTLNGTQGNLTTAVNALRAQGLPVIPTVVDGTAAGTMSTLLADPTRRAGHVNQIVNLVMSNGYDGVDLDYEVFAYNRSQIAIWSSIKPNWIAFVNQLAAELHVRGKLLSVTVPPVWNSGASGYTVYAQAEIAASVDRLRLMVYDWSVSTAGPIAPMSWVNSVIAYSSSVVPVSKLQLGVPAYGRHWAVKKNATDVCPAASVFNDAITLPEIGPLAASHGVTPVRDSYGELTFSWVESSAGEQVVTSTPPGYATSGSIAANVNSPTGEVLGRAQRVNPNIPANCTVQHTVHVPDATSIRQRADAALAAHWSGIAIWALGYETSDVYSALATVSAQRPNTTPPITIDTPVTFTSPTPTGATTTITGIAYHGEFDLPVPVRITVTRQSNGDTATATKLARESRSGLPGGTGPFHGFTQSWFLAADTYTLCVTQLGWGGTTLQSDCSKTFTVTGSA